MLRQLTESELVIVNQMCKKECGVDDFWVLDAEPANDMFESCYNYFLGTSSLLVFKDDLQNNRVPLNVMHQRMIPLGNWLPGELVMMNPPPDGARPGKNMMLKSALCMPKDLTMAGYNTDELAKAYEMGTMTDVSISWTDGTPVCDICHNDLRNWKLCEHIPGQMYDGMKCTFTVENAHLQFISVVDKGGLPNATLLSTGDGINLMISDGKSNWIDKKQLSIDIPFSGMLMAPIITKLKGGDSDMITYKQAKEQFITELAAEFVPVATLQEKEAALTAATEKTTQLETDLAKVTDQFIKANDDLNKQAGLVTIGKNRLAWLTTEFHRLGVASSGDLWIEETKNDLLAGIIEDDKRVAYLEAEIESMKTELKGKVEKEKFASESKDEKKPYTHLDNPELYQVR